MENNTESSLFKTLLLVVVCCLLLSILKQDRSTNNPNDGYRWYSNGTISKDTIYYWVSFTTADGVESIREKVVAQVYDIPEDPEDGKDFKMVD